MSYTDKNAEDRMKEKVLELLPKDGEVIGSDVILQRFTNVGQSKFMKFMGTGLNSYLTAVKGYVTSIHGGRCPKFPNGTETVFMKDVKTCLLRLASMKLETRTLFGQAAVDCHMKWAIMKVKKTPITYDDVRMLNQHAYSLSAPSLLLLRKWNDSIMDPREAAVATAASSSSSSSCLPPAQPGSKRKGPDAVVEMVSKLFKK